jgi:hypothetical protein
MSGSCAQRGGEIAAHPLAKAQLTHRRRAAVRVQQRNGSSLARAKRAASTR